MDPHQARVWSSPFKNSLVEAGAGAGKTYLLIERAKLLLSRGVRPEEIAFMTFTNAAVDEIQHRLRAAVGDVVAKRITVTTIHRHARSVARRLGLPSRFSIHNPHFPNDPYRVAWRKALDEVLKSDQSTEFETNVLPWLVSWPNPTPEGQFQNIFPELYADPSVPTKFGTKVRSKAERRVFEALVRAFGDVRYEWRFLGASIPMKPDMFLPRLGVFVEYLGLWNHEDQVTREEYRASFHAKQEALWRCGLGKALVPIFPEDLIGSAWIGRVRKAASSARLARILDLQASALKRTRDHLDGLADALIQFCGVLIRFEDWPGPPPRYPRALAPVADMVKGMHDSVCRLMMSEGSHEADSFIAALGRYLQNHPHLAKQGLGEVHYLFCDEFQDVYPSLFLFLQQQFRASRTMVIGDSRQSIYGFTGSSPKFMERFNKYVPGTKRFHLPVNRRSAELVLRVSEAILPPAALRAVSTSTDAGRVELVEERHEISSALQTVARTIEEGRSKDLLVLTRVNRSKAAEAEAYWAAADKLGVRAMTFHGAKGLEAETVVVTGLVKRARGAWSIPPNARDHPVVAAIKKANHAQSLEDQERCLLYVALSRARRNLFLVTDPDHTAPLIQPLIARIKLLAGESVAKAKGRSAFKRAADG